LEHLTLRLDQMAADAASAQRQANVAAQVPGLARFLDGAMQPVENSAQSSNIVLSYGCLHIPPERLAATVPDLQPVDAHG
jgi:hypothetical protein